MEIRDNLKITDGIIIKEEDYKEYDKLITILSSDFGKIQIYAFGVRKTNSKNIGKLMLFSFSSFEFRDEKGRYRLENVIHKKSFENIISDYDKMCYASYFIELSDYFGFENNDEHLKLNLLYFTLKAVDDGKVDLKLIKCIFELKMLFFEGIYKDSSKLIDKNDVLKYTWDFIINSKCNKLYTFKLKEDILKRFINEMDFEMKNKINKKFKTEVFL